MSKLVSNHCSNHPSQTQSSLKSSIVENIRLDLPTKGINPYQDHVSDYRMLAEYHLRLSLRMNAHHQFNAALVLCNWAINSILKAVYIHKVHSMDLPSIFTMNEILPLVQGNPPSKNSLEVALFIGTMQNLCEIEEESYTDSVVESKKRIDKLIERTKEVIEELSRGLN
ncbi:hypothetical protein [Paenibacillus sp. JJ-223]|uniref:hypothetical protein n=1 Tax=Paenibacillus sp. JJ-223 TaxID=2905647 RepID=UPI001F385A72|nr:hypothetical protein [Paenibacillus sp. JJ-223]CAH1224396.1 hypothetical protein PAECIP111890_05659 [Paenibacillus sp. JJ-223]